MFLITFKNKNDHTYKFKKGKNLENKRPKIEILRPLIISTYKDGTKINFFLFKKIKPIF